MTKNGTNSANSKQTVSVQSQGGENIGLTYPKRAEGLVKKGRARFVNDNTIRLMDVSDVTHTEDIKMDNINTLNENKNEQRVNRLLFNAREWSFNKDCQKSNVGNRSFMQGPDGNLAEAYTIGDWGYNWTEIVTKTLILPKNTTHTLTFWLNGGENDKNDEVCRFVVVYNNDCDNCYTYNLNRNFIKPLKKVNGWELYEIPFITGDNEYTQLRFVAKSVYDGSFREACRSLRRPARQRRRIRKRTSAAAQYRVRRRLAYQYMVLYQGAAQKIRQQYRRNRQYSAACW